MERRKSKTLSTLPQRTAKKSLRFSLLRFLGLLLIFAGLYMVMGGESGFIAIKSLQKDCQRLELEIYDLQQKYSLLEEEKRQLSHDLGYMEKLAREKLGLVKESEILYRFVEKK